MTVLETAPWGGERRQSRIAHLRHRGAAAKREAAGRRKKGNLRRDAVIAGQATARTERGLVFLQSGRSAKRRQDEHPPLGTVEFGGVGRVLQAVQVRFGKGVEAE